MSLGERDGRASSVRPIIHKRGQIFQSCLIAHCRQPFALVSEHERLKQRVAHLEQFILRTGGNSSSPDDSAFQSFQAQLHRQKQHHEKVLEHLEDEVDSPLIEDELPDSDTEDAALVSSHRGVYPAADFNLDLRFWKNLLLVAN